MTLRDYQRFYVSQRFVSDGWSEQLRIAVRLFEAFAGDSSRVDNLSATGITAWLRAYSGHVAARTANSKRCAILCLWRAAAEDGLCEPPGRVPKVPEPQHLPEAWTVDEIERLLAAARLEPGTIGGVEACRWNPALLLSLYDTGARLGAMLGVQMSDVLFDQRALILRAAHQKQNCDQYCRLSDQTVAAIAATVSPAATGMRVLVFPWPWRRAALYRRMSGICRRANVRYGRGAGGLYGKLRKTSGTLIESAGGDGARHLGNTREVFEKFYYDARFAPSQIDLLPRPK